jgi:DNA-binding winged helix-turn-helix (wHTH) protein/TolB-like protein
MLPGAEHRSVRYSFGDFVLDVAERSLTRLSPSVREDQSLASPVRVPLQPKTFDLLVHLVTHSGRLHTKQTLLDEVWGTIVVTENSLTRCIHQLRAALDDTAEQPRFVETVPRVGYRFIAPVTQLETSPAGLLLESAGNASRARPPEDGPTPVATGRWRYGPASAVAIALLTVLIGVGVYWLSRFDRTTEPAPNTTESASVLPATPRVAVLAFDPIGPNPEAAAQFAATLADAIAGSLSENLVQTLRVGRAAEFEGRQRASALRAIGANFALQGTVRTVDGHVNVRVNFEDLNSEFTIWTGQFQRDAANEALLLSEVTAAVTTVAHPLAEALAQPDVQLDPQTLSLYVKWYEVGSNIATSPAERALNGERELQLAREMVTRFPKFAAGHGALAQSIADAYRSDAAARQEARREANLAISLYPPTGFAYTALYVLARYEAPTDFALAEAELIKGISAAPTFGYLQLRRCNFLLSVGRVSDALLPCDQAVALVPLAPPPKFRRVYALMLAGQTEQAWRALDDVSKRYLSTASVNILRYDLLESARQDREAVAVLKDAAQRPIFVSLEGVAPLEAAFQAAATRLAPDVDVAINSLSAAIAAKSLRPIYAIRMAARLNRVDEGLDWLATALLDDFEARAVLFEPGIDRLRRDPRFMTIVARAGLVSYWRKTGVWPDFCADATLPYDCKVEAEKADASIASQG